MEKIKICLISCVSQKTNYPTKCKDLYISPLFNNSWNYVRDIGNLLDDVVKSAREQIEMEKVKKWIKKTMVLIYLEKCI